MPYANNKDADQPAHLRSLISAFVVRCLDSIKPIVAKSKISRLHLVSVAAQTGLRLTWSETPEDRFSRDEAHMFFFFFFFFIILSHYAFLYITDKIRYFFKTKEYIKVIIVRDVLLWVNVIYLTLTAFEQ